MKRALIWILAAVLGFAAIGGFLAAFDLIGHEPALALLIDLAIPTVIAAAALASAQWARRLAPRPKPGRPAPRRYQERRPWERNGPPSQ